MEDVMEEKHDAIKEAMLTYTPQLEQDYKDYVRRIFAAMVKDLGPELKDVYNSWIWARTFTGVVRANVTTVQEGNVFSPKNYVIDESFLDRNAKEYAKETATLWYNKMWQKLGALEDVTVSDVSRAATNGFLTITGKHGDDKVVIEQQRILNVSRLGTLFHQFPAHIYVNGKFKSENEYKGIADAWGVARIEENKPKREPIDPNTRPKTYVFDYLEDYPANQYGPARPNCKASDRAKGMNEAEALAKVKRNIERSASYGSNKTAHDFRCVAIFAWNGRLLWRESSGQPKPDDNFQFVAPAPLKRANRRQLYRPHRSTVASQMKAING